MPKTVSTTKKTTKFKFAVAQSIHCCGMLEVGGWEKDEDRASFYGQIHKAEKFRPEEIFGIFDNELQEQVNQYGRDVWDRSTTEGGYYAQATFVTENAGRQHTDYKSFLPLLEHMLANGWTKTHEWKNPNSENTIVLVGKFIEMIPEEEDNE